MRIVSLPPAATGNCMPAGAAAWATPATIRLASTSAAGVRRPTGGPGRPP